MGVVFSAVVAGVYTAMSRPAHRRRSRVHRAARSLVYAIATSPKKEPPIDDPLDPPVRDRDGPPDALERLAFGDPDADEYTPTARLRLDPDVFVEQDERRRKALRMQDAIRPGRTTSIALRLDRFTLKRLRALATLRGVRYQTLLKQFVVERLYEEEKRAGIIDP